MDAVAGQACDVIGSAWPDKSCFAPEAAGGVLLIIFFLQIDNFLIQLGPAGIDFGDKILILTDLSLKFINDLLLEVDFQFKLVTLV